MRRLAPDLVGDDTVVAEGLATLRDDIADIQARLEAGEALAETLPHRRKYLLLVYALVRRLLDVHLEWLDEVERELEPAKTVTERGGSARAGRRETRRRA